MDDDASLRRSTRRLVRSLGFRGDAFGSAEEFLESGRAPETACLILDVRMPGTDGLELQRRLADSGLRIPIVFLTARASVEEERRARHAGALAFLRKPVAKEALLEAIPHVCEPSADGRGDDYDDGRTTVRAHGDPDMPVWGDIFRDNPAWEMTRRAGVRGTLVLITEYLRSVQEK